MSAVIDLAALPPTVIVPGIAHWLGLPQPADDTPDTYEDYLNQLSQDTAA